MRPVSAGYTSTCSRTPPVPNHSRLCAPSSTGISGYQLTSVPGVSEVASVGGFEKTYEVTVDPAKLPAFGIPVARVMSAMRGAKSGREPFVRLPGLGRAGPSSG